LQYYDAHRFWEETLVSRFDLTGVGHGAYGHRYNEFLYRAKIRAFFAALERNHLSMTEKSVLDIGCGIGVFTEIARKLGCGRYVGVDIADVVVDRMHRRYPYLDFRALDVSRPLHAGALPAPSFDIVLCLDVIYHVVDPSMFAQALETIWSLVAPGGFLLLNDSFWKEDLIPGGTLEDQVSGVVPHVRFHKRADYERELFRRHDIELLDMVPMYYLFNRPIVGARFPWSHPRLSWHLRYRLFEWTPLLETMFTLDRLLTRYVRANPSLKLMVARRTPT
jgi:SAM-dependent methyltransferase